MSEGYHSTSKQSKVEELSYVFKETKKFITVMIYMRNYADG